MKLKNRYYKQFNPNMKCFLKFMSFFSNLEQLDQAVYPFSTQNIQTFSTYLRDTVREKQKGRWTMFHMLVALQMSVMLGNRSQKLRTQSRSPTGETGTILSYHLLPPCSVLPRSQAKKRNQLHQYMIWAFYQVHNQAKLF